MQVKVVEVNYDHSRWMDFSNAAMRFKQKAFMKNTVKAICLVRVSKYCEEDIDFMLLPKNEKRERKMDLNPDKWFTAIPMWESPLSSIV